MKKLFAIVPALLLCIVLFSAASPVSDSPEQSVYASPEEQEYLYGLTQVTTSDMYRHLEYGHIRILKESITPVYLIDIMEFAASGTMKLVRSTFGDPDLGCPGIYVVKALMEDDEFAGNLWFCIRDGEACFLSLAPSSAYAQYRGRETGQSPAPCSYADHAVRISELLNSKSMIPPKDVIYVSGPRVGACFLVSFGGEKYLIPLGYTNLQPRPFVTEPAADPVIDMDEFREIALRYEANYNEMQKRKEEWLKEHPGETWIGAGDVSDDEEQYICSSFENVIDINKFLLENGLIGEAAASLPTEGPAETEGPTALPETSPGPDPEPAAKTGPSPKAILIAVGSAVLLSAIVLGFVLIKRKAAR